MFDVLTEKERWFLTYKNNIRMVWKPRPEKTLVFRDLRDYKKYNNIFFIKNWRIHTVKTV